jgi:hypothetical protein
MDGLNGGHACVIGMRMKPRILLFSTLLLMQSCDKPDEKPASGGALPPAAGPEPEKSTRRSVPVMEAPPAVPAPGTAEAPPVEKLSPPTPQELEAFYALADALVEDVREAMAAETPLSAETRSVLRPRMLEAIKTRSRFLRSMEPALRRDAITRLRPLMEVYTSVMVPSVPDLRRPGGQGTRVPTGNGPGAAPPKDTPPAPSR